MKVYYPIKVPCDLSEAAIEVAHEQIFKPDYTTLIVGPRLVSLARQLEIKYTFIKGVYVILELPEDSWALRSQYSSVFSEGA